MEGRHFFLQYWKKENSLHLSDASVRIVGSNLLRARILQFRCVTVCYWYNDSWVMDGGICNR